MSSVDIKSWDCSEIGSDAWLKQYNQFRLNRALNMCPPVPENLLRNDT